MNKSQKGFTLIELVIVIVILGLLAAFAIPRYINITRDARIASMNGLGGGLRGSVALARAQYIVTGNMAAATVTMDGVAVACAPGTGIPTGAAAGIGTAIQDYSGFTPGWGNPTTFLPVGGNLVNCVVRYAPATGVVTVLTGGCP